MKNCWASPAPFSLALFSGTIPGGGQGSDKALDRFSARAGRGRVFQGLTGGPGSRNCPIRGCQVGQAWFKRSPHPVLGLLSLPTPSLGLPTHQTPPFPLSGSPLLSMAFLLWVSLKDPLEVQHQSYSHCPLQELLTPHTCPLFAGKEKKTAGKRKKKNSPSTGSWEPAKTPVREECLETSGASRRPRMPG